MPGFEAVSWHLIVAPAHTPKVIVDRLHSELKSIMTSPEMERQLIDMGLIPIDSPAVEDLRRFVNSEIDRWGNLVHQAGVAGSE